MALSKSDHFQPCYFSLHRVVHHPKTLFDIIHVMFNKKNDLLPFLQHMARDYGHIPFLFLETQITPFW